MHELLNFACDELEELESKAKRGKLSMTDVQYADTLAHMKKNLLAAEGMMGGMSNNSRRSYESSERSYESYEGNSNARRGRDGDGDGRYSEGSFRNSQSRGSYDSYEYSREGTSRNMKRSLEAMLDEPINERTRMAVLECLEKIS